MDRKIAISWLRRGKPLAVRMTASGSDLLAWIGVTPLDLSDDTTKGMLQWRGHSLDGRQNPAYRVRKFEVSKELIDKDIHFGECELCNKED